MNLPVMIPQMVLAFCAMAILMVGAFQKKSSGFFCTMLAVGALLATGIFLVLTPDGTALYGSILRNAFTTTVDLTLLISAVFCLILAVDFNKREGFARFEYAVLFLLSVLGMMIMIGSNGFLSLYVGLELQALTLYILSGLHRDNLRSSEAAVKNFVLGALSSGILLYGISLVYGFAGGISYQTVAAGISAVGALHIKAGLIVGAVLVMIGILFKLSIVPFHMWTPDVYEGAPTSVTVFMGTAAKLAAMALLIRVMMTAFGGLIPVWRDILVFVALASMIWGALGAIGQKNIKRMMAYSSIGHMGYALIGVAAGTIMGIEGAIIYLIIYVFMTIGTFACIMAMRRNGVMVENIKDLAGLAKTHPRMALLFGVFLFSLAGIPPLTGFFAKFYVFMAAVQANMWGLAIVGILTSVIGAYYYIRVVKVIYFDKSAETATFEPWTPSLATVAGITGLFTTFFFLYPEPVIGAARLAAKVLFK